MAREPQIERFPAVAIFPFAAPPNLQFTFYN